MRLSKKNGSQKIAVKGSLVATSAIPPASCKPTVAYFRIGWSFATKSQTFQMIVRDRCGSDGHIVRDPKSDPLHRGEVLSVPLV